jgi:hypothetical protein
MKMKRPGRAATGAYSEWILLSAIRSNANTSMLAATSKGASFVVSRGGERFPFDFFSIVVKASRRS